MQTYWLEFSERSRCDSYQAKPGQFNMLYVPGVGEAALSLSRIPSQGEALIHTVRSVGNVTRTLAAMRINDSLGVRGPFGSSWPIEKSYGHDVILVAGGIGLAPLRPAIDQIMRERFRFGRVTLLVGARSPVDLLYAEEYAAWEAGDIDVQTTVDRAPEGWTGQIGVVTLLLNRLTINSPDETLLFSCGPEVMMTYAIRLARERRIPRENVFLSLERNMNCAIGHCGHCQFGPHFICKDGPVLRYDRVNDLMRVDSL